MSDASPKDTCTQSGHPSLAGSRRYMMASCHACDSASWCWSFSYQTANEDCAACENQSWCHPEDVESDTNSCLACDDYLICRAGKANGGRCLFAEQEGGCVCQAGSAQ